MSGKLIYGVDPSKKVTPTMVRDAIIECFVEAHEEVLNEMKEYGEFKSKKDLKETKRNYVVNLIKGIFKEVDGDFGNPTKESIIAVCEKLAAIASNFWKPEVIEKHYGEIMQLVNKLE